MTLSRESRLLPKSDLFGADPAVNLLPCDGTVNYYGPVLTSPESERYFAALLENVPWKSDEAVIFGRHIVTARQVAWYGDSDYAYTYSGTTKQASPGMWNCARSKRWWKSGRVRPSTRAC